MDAIGDRSSADSGLGRRLVGNTLVQVVTPALRMALGIALAAVLSRYLGAEGLGSYALVFAYVATFDGVFNEWGLGTILLREISRRPDDRDGLLVSGASLQGAVACGTYALMLGALPFMHYPAPVNRAIALYGLTLFAAPLNMLSLSFQADLALARLLPASLLGALLHFTLSLVVVALRGPLLWLVVAAAGALAMQYVVIARLCLPRLRAGGRPALSHWGPLLREAWPLGLATIFGTAMQQAPILVLSWFSLREAGLFGAAAKIPQQLFMLPLVVRNSTFPLLARSWTLDKGQFARRLDRLLNGTVLIAVPVVVLGAGLARPITSLLFGTDFAQAALPFALLLTVFGLIFPGLLVGEAMTVAGLQRVNLAIQSVAAPALFLLLLLLVPRGGAAGAALAQLLSYALLVAATFVAARGRLGETMPLKPLVMGGAGVLAGAATLLLVAPLGAWAAAALAALTSVSAMVVLQPARARELFTLALFAGARSG